MKFTEMKMTVTLSELEIKELIAEKVAQELGRAVNPTDVKINVTTKTEGDQRDSYTVAVFQNITVEVKGK